MNFHINKDATLPPLVMEVVNDGRNNYKDIHEKLQNATITFSMTSLDTGIKKIGGQPAKCLLKEVSSDCPDEEYYLAYNFRAKDTNKAGTYVGEFKIVFLDGSGTLIVPIKDELFINIREGSIRK